MAVWDLADIHGEGERDALLSELTASAEKFKGLRERLGPDLSQAAFMAAIADEEKMNLLASRLSARASLTLAEDLTDGNASAVSDTVSRECTRAANDIMFFGLWFKDLPGKQAQRLIDGAGKYSYFLKRLRAFKDHVLSEKEEKIINVKDLTGADALVKLYETIVSRFSFDFKGQKMNMSQMNRFKTSPERADRVGAYDATLDRFRSDRDVLGEVYRNIVNDWVNETCSMRSYERPISSRNLANDVPDGAVSAMLHSVREKAGIFKCYFRLKAKIMGFADMDRYDLYAPYGGHDSKYAYDDSVKKVLSVYAGFDERFGRFAKAIFDAGHVHSDITPTKQSGAFCMSYSVEGLPYLLLNHNGELEDLFAMMHETGHGIHSQAASRQTEFTFHSSLVLAETASEFGELLLSKTLLAEGEKEEKIAVLMRMLDNQYASITRQAHFTEFEIWAHEMVPKGATIDDLDAAYIGRLREDLGGAIEVPDIFADEWLSIPHIYGSPFYCYSYSMAKLMVLSLYKRYEDDGDGFTDDLYGILSAGSSDSPANILASVGMDITDPGFWSAGFDIIEAEIEELERLCV